MTVDIEFKRDAIKIKFKKGGGGRTLKMRYTIN